MAKRRKIFGMRYLSKCKSNSIRGANDNGKTQFSKKVIDFVPFPPIVYEDVIEEDVGNCTGIFEGMC